MGEVVANCTSHKSRLAHHPAARVKYNKSSWGGILRQASEPKFIGLYLILTFARATQLVRSLALHIALLRSSWYTPAGANEEPLTQAGKRLVMFTKEAV
ncbi:MAG: hypothetical protein K0S79_641 [Nitrospira sp.]|nr:hypothetical protein [Nitrospira sp.]